MAMVIQESSENGLGHAVTDRRQVVAFSWIELLIVPGLIALQLLCLRDPIPFTHSFWLDEIHTQLLVDDPSLTHATNALAAGVDFNPPTYYLLARLTALTGVAPEISQRVFSLACVVACCVCVYLLVRERCTRTTAATAALLIWSFDVVQSQAFESRFYAPWLAAVGLTSLCLQRCTTSPALVWRVGLLVGSSVICTVHYFGVISLGLIVGAHLLQQWLTKRGGYSTLLWMTPGVVLLIVCITTFYRGQRSALSVATWVPPVDWSSTWQFLRELVPIWSLAIALMVWLFARRQNVSGHHSSDECDSSAARSWPPAALGLMLMPVCLMAFSLLIQPALVSRYGSVGIIGFAVLLGALLRPAPTWIAATFGVWFFVAGLQTLGSQVERWQRTEARQAEMIARLRQVDRSLPLLFESRHAMYPITRYAPDLAPRVRFLALSNQNLRDFNSVTPFRIVERDVALRIEEFYPTYQTLPFDELRTLPRAIIVAFRQRKDFGKQLDGFAVTQLQPQIYEVVPQSRELGQAPKDGVAPTDGPAPVQPPDSGETLVGNH